MAGRVGVIVAAMFLVFAIFFGIFSFYNFAQEYEGTASPTATPYTPAASTATPTTTPTPTTATTTAGEVKIALIVEGKWDRKSGKGSLEIKVSRPNVLAVLFNIIRLAISQYSSAYVEVEVRDPYGGVIFTDTKAVPSGTFHYEWDITKLREQYYAITVKARLVWQRPGRYGIPNPVVIDEKTLSIRLK